MQRQVITAVLVVASALSTPAVAHAEILQCVDAEGKILLTDLPCPEGTAMSIPAPGSTEPEAAVRPEAVLQRTYSQQELDQLLAPIALYPDALLAQVLMAATYPLEVVEASRWLKAHSDLKGEPLQAALLEQSWDPSVKGLVTVPQVLAMMDEKLDWTQRLGDAFLEQREAVMDTVQSLRARAQGAGNLATTPQQTVTTEGGTVRVEETNPEVYYVPVYNPALVYGPWWWPAPPYYWYPPGFVVPGPGIYFGFGVFVGHAIWGSCDWRRHSVIVNVPHYNDFNHTRRVDPHWSHNVEHRKGVPYQDQATRLKFRREIPGADARRDFRGYPPGSSYGTPLRPPADQPRQPPAYSARPPGAAPLGQQPPRPAPGAPSAPIGGLREPRMPAPVPAPSPGLRPLPGAAPLGQQPPRPAAGAPSRPIGGLREPRIPPPVPAPSPGLRPPPAFETFGRGDATKAYANRGAESRAGVPGVVAPRPTPAPGAPRPGPAPGAARPAPVPGTPPGRR